MAVRDEQAGVYGILADRAVFMQSAARDKRDSVKTMKAYFLRKNHKQTRERYCSCAGLCAKSATASRRHSMSRVVMTMVLGAILLSGCSGQEEDFDLQGNIRDAYVDAQHAVEVGNYRKAIGIFEALQARFPFSEFSTQIQLELAYAYYRDGNIDAAIDAADTFLRENPTHLRVDYATYVKGLAYFERDQGWLERVFRKDINKRPPRDGEVAFSLFSRLVERYPASEYAADGQQRMVYLRNRLAAYENVVARFYMEREAYVAALARVRTALELYNGADSGQESLQIMIEAYEKLGMHDLADDTRRVLENNFSADPMASN
jgi:outer membrane protein assembly factor BamD